VKFLFVSDVHADWVTYGVSRYEEIAKSMHETVAVAIEEEVDAYFFLGDLSDPEDGIAALRSLGLAMGCALELGEAGVQSFWLTGNHDVIENGRGESVLSPMAAMGHPLVELIDAPLFDVRNDRSGQKAAWNLIALPFTASSHGYDPAAFVEACGRQLSAPRHAAQSELPTIVVGHMTHIPGVQPGEETKEMPRGRETAFPLDAVAAIKGTKFVANGHYHRQQKFVADNGLEIHIPGSLARLTMGEERNEPGYLLVEI
jgi:DNA repair exonuclease SbcCD nuclease subunit